MMNKVAINAFVHVFRGWVVSYLLSEYQDWNFCILVLTDNKKQFFKVFKIVFTMTPLMHKSSSCSISFITFDTASLINFSHVGVFIVAFHWGFIINFPYSSWSHMDHLYPPLHISLKSPQDSVPLFQKWLLSETAWCCWIYLEFGFWIPEYRVERVHIPWYNLWSFYLMPYFPLSFHITLLWVSCDLPIRTCMFLSTLIPLHK